MTEVRRTGGLTRLIGVCAIASAAAGPALADRHDPAPPLPHVIYGPGASQPPAEPPAAASDAQPRASGSTCEAILYLAHYNMFCPLPVPRALGADCTCPFGPPPPGILPSPPAAGRVVP